MSDDTRHEDTAMQRLCTIGRLPLRALALVVIGLPLGACIRDRLATGSVHFPDDYRERHPIAMVDAPRNLDVFAGGSPHGLDRRQRQDVYAFAADYARGGQGLMTAIVPIGTPRAAETRRTLAAIRGTLADSGLGAGALAVVSYVPDDPALAAPIRLKFNQLQAKVASQCGQWPGDLASGSSIEGWHNRPYWNFGCATQANLAGQVADPVDLVRGRQETPVDTAKRLNAIGKIRRGQDPSTDYKQDATRINQAVGN